MDDNSQNDENDQSAGSAGGFVGNAPQNEPTTRGGIGSGRGKKIIIGIVLAIIVIFMLNSIFGGETKNTAKVNLHGGENGEANKIAKGDDAGGEASVALPPPPKATIQQPAPTLDNSLLPPPDLPPVLDKTDNTLGIPAPPPLLAATSSESGLFKGGKADKEIDARIHSNMLLVDGGKTETAVASSCDTLAQSDPNRAFACNATKATVADKEAATHLSNLGLTIAQGKIVNAVLETAINTQLPGTLRAIVSRDTYAETGRTILIPKGSRLIGTYNTGVLRGQNRVMIIWTRLIRPDGIDIMIGSPGIDGLGRAGIEGYVDSRYLEIFSTAILTTALSLGGAEAAYQIMPKQSTTTSGNGSNTTTNINPAQQSAADAVTSLTSTSKEVIQNIINIAPTVTIDQGTRINVFVNRDLTFPSEVDNAMFVQ